MTPRRKIAVFTGSRADYGLLHWLMKDIQRCEQLQLQVLVSGSHLSPVHGLTVQEIEADGLPIDERVDMLLSSDHAVGVAKAMGLGMIGFANALERLKPDVLMVLGDRFEALAVAQTALVMGIPIAHLHGGELSEGAYDDAIRHALTKMASLHLTASLEYAQRVIQMGEPPDRVHCVGALGVENLDRDPAMKWHELQASLPIGSRLNQPYVLLTYHPCTRAREDGVQVLHELEAAFNDFKDLQVLLTYPNADNGGRRLIDQIGRWSLRQPGRVIAVPSLGRRRYVCAMRHATAVIGNSSSGLIEAPSLGVPTINIGLRQQGRLAAPSVIQCETSAQAISQALRLSLSKPFQAICHNKANPYGQGRTAEHIVRLLCSMNLDLCKPFHDLEVRPC
jgi:UDP-hydrolysing UDP-N-acetyl-D-glucosamine 2-epimerase